MLSSNQFQDLALACSPSYVSVYVCIYVYILSPPPPSPYSINFGPALIKQLPPQQQQVRPKTYFHCKTDTSNLDPFSFAGDLTTTEVTQVTTPESESDNKCAYKFFNRSIIWQITIAVIELRVCAERHAKK